MKVLGLFSGIGGFELGLRKAGFQIAKLCETESHCQRVLAKNFDAPIHSDVRTLAAIRGEFDVICGGFPCQDISIAGKGVGLLGGEKSSLWREFLRLINDGKPRFAVIENVSAFLSRGLNIALQDLARIGYDAAYTTFDTKYFGLPQRRRRVYVVAVRDGIPENADIFNISGRSTTSHFNEVESFDSGFKWDFTQGDGVENPFAFFTRQRSDQFATVGLSGTLAKRDYKSYTDLVFQNSRLRRVTPTERLLLQGFPPDWWDGCGLTDDQKFTCNGMSVPVVEHIGGLINEFNSAI